MKGNKQAYPSIKEVVMGVYEHLMVKVEVTFKDIIQNKPEKFYLYRKEIRKTFNYMVISLEMNDSDIDKPMTDKIFSNPYSPEVLLILNLYSMEPPFYADVNNASRELDKSKLKTLGPFAMAICKVLANGVNSDKKREDAIE